MVFSSFSFLWLFLPALFFFYRLIPQNKPNWQNMILLIASLVFYSWGQQQGVLVLIICILVDYVFGFFVCKKDNGNNKIPKLFLAIIISLNLIMLGYYKYHHFIVSSINQIAGTRIGISEIIPPIGVSFFTLKSISYLVDI